MKIYNIWPNTKIEDTDLQWLVDNQRKIINNKEGARGMPAKNRPIKLWADGRVRVEFVGTYKSTSEARKYLESYVTG